MTRKLVTLSFYCILAGGVCSIGRAQQSDNSQFDSQTPKQNRLLPLSGIESSDSNSKKQDDPKNAVTVRYLLSDKPAEDSTIIILESGLGDGLEIWEKTLPELEKLGQVFSYSRKGYVGSQDFTTDRTSNNIVAELRANLSRLELKPKYVLVGHSLGGVFVQTFARQFPDEVAGVVLVDSLITDLDLSDAHNPINVRFSLARLFASQTIINEYGQHQKSVEQMNESPRFPNIPLAVVCGGKTLENAPQKTKRAFVKAHQNLSRQSKQGHFIKASGSGHVVQMEQPEKVIEAVSFVVRQIKRRTK